MSILCIFSSDCLLLLTLTVSHPCHENFPHPSLLGDSFAECTNAPSQQRCSHGRKYLICPISWPSYTDRLLDEQIHTLLIACVSVARDYACLLLKSD